MFFVRWAGTPVHNVLGIDYRYAILLLLYTYSGPMFCLKFCITHGDQGFFQFDVIINVLVSHYKCFTLSVRGKNLDIRI